MLRGFLVYNKLEPRYLYSFKGGGLIKKSMTVKVGGVLYYLILYYTADDVIENKFSTPLNDSRFQNTSPYSDLITQRDLYLLNRVYSLDRLAYNTYSTIY